MIPKSLDMTRLTSEDLERLRATSAPILSGVGVTMSSESFKSTQSKLKPRSKLLDDHLSNESRGIGKSNFKKTAILNEKRNIIRMGVGRPNAELYPWDSASFNLSHPACLIGTAEPRLIAEKQHCLDIGTALNYGSAMGSPRLIRFLTEHVEIVHDPPYSDWSVCLTPGSTSSIESALRIFCNGGDIILSEEFTYPGFSEAAALVGVRIQGVTMDANGLRSDVLDVVLSTWDLGKGGKPKLLYTIPTGQNPTGCTQSSERRNAIYEVAEKHNLIIVEDDPYFFLNLEALHDETEFYRSLDMGGKACLSSYCSSLLPSFLSIDHSGRVIRLDSAAKILCPGLRGAWVTASSRIIDKFIAYNETNAIVSGPSEIMMYELFENKWRHQGFLSWLAHLSLIYRRRRDTVESALRDHLPAGLCSWDSPQYGMFLWLHLNLEKHHLSHCQNIQTQTSLSALESDVEGRLLTIALQNGVQVTGGSMFATDDSAKSGIHLRITYAAAAESELKKGVIILAETIRKEFGIAGI